MIRIALVGDIGSGKTFFSKLFRYPIFNADLVVSNLYQKDKFLLFPHQSLVRLCSTGQKIDGLDK